MDELQEVTILVAPDHPDTVAASDSSNYVDDPVRRFVLDAAKQALQGPRETKPTRCDTVSIVLTIGGIRDDVEVKLAALPILLIERYCAGGRTAVDSFAREVGAQLLNLSDPGYRWPIDASGNKVPPPPQECADAFLEALRRSEDQLENTLASTLLSIAQGVWALGSSKIKDLEHRLTADARRYRVVPAPGGAEGGPGTDNPEETPDNGSDSDDDSAENDTSGADNPKDTKNAQGKDAGDLVDAVRSLIDAANALMLAQLPPGGENKLPEGAEGGPGDQVTEEEKEAQRKQNIKRAEKAYTDTLAEVMQPPRDHIIAPALIAHFFGSSTKPIPIPSPEEIQNAVNQYLYDTRALLKRALTKKSMAPELRQTLFGGPKLEAQNTSPRPSLRSRLSAITKPADVDSHDLRDRLELRAAVWAMDSHEYIYEPLNDERLLLNVLDTYKESVKAAATNEDQFVAWFRYRTLASLIDARRDAELIQRLEQERDGVGLKVLSEGAALLDLLALVRPLVIAVPVLGPAAAFFGIVALVAGAIQQILDTPETMRRTDALTVSSLLSEDQASYMALVANRPTIFSVCVSLALNNAAMMKGFGALAERTPRLALALRVGLDLDPLLEPIVKDRLGRLLQEANLDKAAQ